MKSLNKEKLIINLGTKLIIKNKILKSIESYYNFDELKNQNILILIDKYIYNNKSKINYIKNSLNNISNISFTINEFSEPTFNHLNYLKKKCIKKKFKLIISIGGGSTIDLGKALSIALVYNGPLEKLQGQDKFNQKTIPVIAIPSIFGSGAELTPSAVLINEKTGFKGGINSELIRPIIAILDPYLAKTTNYKQHIICAFDALVHSIESYTSIISNQFTKIMSKNGTELVLKGMLNIKKNPLNSIENIALGSVYSIIALMHSEQSLTGASSYQLAIHKKINHAHSGAIFLNKSLSLLKKNNNKEIKELIHHIHKRKLIPKKSINSLIETLNKLNKQYQINSIKLTKDEINFLSKKIVSMPMLKYTSPKITLKQIKEFLNYE